MLLDEVLITYRQHFADRPTTVVQAPGRVNLIGEHTDYNDGFVLPMAIDRAIWIALRPRPDRQVKLYSINFQEEVSFSFDHLVRNDTCWIEYIKGVTWALQQKGYNLAGWEGVVAGDIPVGAGLSSSAALELASAYAFADVGKWLWEPLEMAKLGRHVENSWMGINSGIMDQLISAKGKAGSAVLIDCRSLETQTVPLPEGCSILVMDTMTRRSLVVSEYNTRRIQCQAAADFFKVPALRDVTLEQFELKSSHLDPLIRSRAKHIITENTRTLKARDAMLNGDAGLLGKLMSESHLSMRDDFEISNRELNIMVEIACRQEGCYGSRMTGGGFGGCAIALVNTHKVENFIPLVEKYYLLATGLTPKLYVCNAADGAGIVNV